MATSRLDRWLDKQNPAYRLSGTKKSSIMGAFFNDSFFYFALVANEIIAFITDGSLTDSSLIIFLSIEMPDLFSALMNLL